MTEYSAQDFTDPFQGKAARPPDWDSYPMPAKQTALCQQMTREGMIRVIFRNIGVEPQANLSSRNPRLNKMDLAAIVAKLEELIQEIRGPQS